MKVNIQVMSEAYDRINTLYEKLRRMEDELRSIMFALNAHRLGHGSVSEAVVKSLAGELKAIENRAIGAKRLAFVLRSAINHYYRAEKEAMEVPDPLIVFHAVNLIDKFTELEPIAYIDPRYQIKVVERYVMPLLATGKKGTT